jgi:hypothetical protein
MADAGFWIFGFIVLWAIVVCLFIRGSRTRPDPDGFCQNVDNAIFDTDMLAEIVAHPIGWQSWEGGRCPVPSDSLVNVMFADGEMYDGVIAGELRWDHIGSAGDIVAWRTA